MKPFADNVLNATVLAVWFQTAPPEERTTTQKAKLLACCMHPLLDVYKGTAKRWAVEFVCNKLSRVTYLCVNGITAVPVCEAYSTLDESMALLPKPSGCNINTAKCLDASPIERHPVELWKLELGRAQV